MSSLWQSVTGFVSRNRSRLVIASVVAIAVTVYVNYPWAEEPEEESERERNKRSHIRMMADSRQARPNRSRLLLRIRRQFDTATGQFLPTLRVKIVEVVDINGTVRHIKALRAQATENQEELEARLWNEIKNASFAMLVVTVYMLSAVCTLLRIQLHILARSLTLTQQDEGLDSHMFRALIEGTYKQLFGSGLHAFAALVKQRVAADLRDWTVKDKLQVDFDELRQALQYVRRNLESDLEGMIRTIFIPPEAAADLPCDSPPATPPPPPYSPEAAAVQGLLDQTWDLLESPAFSTVYTEAVDCTFKIVLDSLRPAFASEGQARTPPLASLLPQIKAVAGKLLPTASAGHGGVSAEVKEISQGPYLEAFCIAIFDAPVS
ncbi:Peroxin-3 [Ochromonadaceae sp. CCMP2298]|nr:Peroxin-3 [Ochromonadaceae sp. CCMP2298]